MDCPQVAAPALPPALPATRKRPRAADACCGPSPAKKPRTAAPVVDSSAASAAGTPLSLSSGCCGSPAPPPPPQSPKLPQQQQQQQHLGGQPEPQKPVPSPASAALAAAVARSFSADATPGQAAEDLLVGMLTRDLEDLCDANEGAAAGPGQPPCAAAAYAPAAAAQAEKLKMFYSAFKQPFDLEFYVRRLVQYTHCSTSAFIAAMVYLDRLQTAAPALRLSYMNCHRLLMTAVVLAAKYLDDELYANAYYARVGGLTTEELNRLEAAMLDLLDWRLSVSPETFSVYDESLLSAIAASECGSESDGDEAQAVARQDSLEVTAVSEAAAARALIEAEASQVTEDGRYM